MTEFTVQSGMDSARLPFVPGVPMPHKLSGPTGPNPRVITDIGHRNQGERARLTAASSPLASSAEALLCSRDSSHPRGNSKSEARDGGVAETPVWGGLFDANLKHDFVVNFERKPSSGPSV